MPYNEINQIKNRIEEDTILRSIAGQMRAGMPKEEALRWAEREARRMGLSSAYMRAKIEAMGTVRKPMLELL